MESIELAEAREPQNGLSGVRPRRRPPTGKPRREPFLEFLAALDSIAADSDHTIGQLAIAWTLRRPEVTSAIVGARRPGQITETAQAGDWQLSETELAAIANAHAEFISAFE